MISEEYVAAKRLMWAISSVKLGADPLTKNTDVDDRLDNKKAQGVDRA